ncbi:hypoxanthine phosphoribosyltransferase [Solidesulfovibrio carbinoliphilus subsp. oakridgensis]|uniref:Hypoxanthine phosphoribosyltransferase n=1 Tax=Solidesulfovibrio carbinoliphilus subsp. oakridgensis TaxID=694327 RepID=G7Q4K5_9BACT|nr:hypoxanthine phosphoribosyltransferase [Solidesulfovibrio carbinoliphilus]EHJ47228.1 hypoxanthine phosphoribosyltransferase [Solidesulfovibrio carbinoliphilus subsp. oakridgensis]
MSETLREVYGEAAIKARVAELGREVSAAYAGRDVVLVGVLKGALPFMADLLRALDFCPTLDFVRVASYGGGTAPGELRFLMDIETDIAGRDVLLVEDIVDTGRTLAYLLTMLSRRNPASLKVCTFLDKPYRREADVAVDFVGFSAPPVFLVGYGMDIGERLRRLRGVYELVR